QIPPMKLFRAGVPNDDIFTLLAENVRNPAQVIGDVYSFIAANAVGAERLSAFMNEYGIHNLEALAAVLQGRSETAMREAITAIPDGVYTSEVWNNPLGTPLRYPVKLTVKGDTIEVDFHGAPQQQPQGGFNCTLNYTASHATYPLKCMLTPNVRGNAGCYRAFTVKAPEGSLLNCDKPMAVNLRTRTGWYIAPNIFTALAKAAPGRVQAATGLPVAINIYGRDAAGQIYSDHLFVGGGQGGSEAGDGVSALQWPTSAANTSVELFEQRVPVLVTEKAYVPDSGGPGQHRGGLGQVVSVRKLDGDGLPTLASVYPEGVGIEVPGLFGGKAGRSARGVVRDATGAIIRDCGTGQLVSTTTEQEIIEVCLSGGSGFGSPYERAHAAIARDLAEGYITAEAAARDYGVAIGADGSIDMAQSEKRREPSTAAE
ncbi:MAG: hydantoinase B/oxoprolinase family protein, partial [Bradyrhizobium sp.]|nr:hydantoinase B/oxoprolinase family protein [Bradyrhizobium sp.]